VVILGALSYNGGDPSTVRAQDVQSNSFKVQIQEWDYLDGPHTTESLSYMVVEAGNHHMPDGTEYEAGTLSVGNDFVDVNLDGNFGSNPAVFSQVVSDDHNTPLVTRMQWHGDDKFSVRVQAEEAKGSNSPGEETVAYFVTGTGQGEEWSCGRSDGSNDVDHTDRRIDFAA
jgi:hypothetical protein